MKAKTIAIVANKGGVAKTSTALNLAYGLMNKDKRVLLIDLDPSSNATAVVLDQDENVSVSEQGAEKYREIFIEKQKDMTRIKACYEAMHEYLQQVELPCDIHDILEKELDIHLGIRKTRFKDLDIVPASNLLSTTDIKLKEAFNRSNRLRRAIQKVEDEYDFIIIDNQPFENSLTYNSISSCYKEGDLIISPTKISLGGLQGIDSTLFTCLEWIEKVEPLPYDFKLLITMKNRNKADDVWTSALKETFGDFMFDTVIRYQGSPVAKADLDHKILLERFPKENVSLDYQRFVDEVAEMN